MRKDCCRVQTLLALTRLLKKVTANKENTKKRRNDKKHTANDKIVLLAREMSMETVQAWIENEIEGVSDERLWQTYNARDNMEDI
jgi:hypothetical protein